MTMRISLVHPAGSNFVPGKNDVTRVANRIAPIGLLSIAAFLEERGHDVHVYDALGPDAANGIEGHLAQIQAHSPELVGFSTTTSGFWDAYEMATALKQSNPEVTTVFGGVHVSGVGAPLLSRFPHIDYLVMGEGELTLAELVEGVPKEEVQGLVYRPSDADPSGGVVTNPPRTHIPALDSLPFPAYHLLDGFPRQYHLPPFNYIHTPGTAISTSRGCVYQCSYCDRSVFGRSFRSNSADYVYAHLTYLRERFGIRHVNIYDDLFTTNRARILAFCERMAGGKFKMGFNCSVRVGHADDELLTALKGAGCLMVSVGVESGDPAMLESLKAGVTLADVEDTVSRIQRAGLRAKGLFMMGVEGETEESVRRTSDFILRLGLDDMNLSKFTPFPGAPCFATIGEHGTFIEEWRRMNALNFVFVPNAFTSPEQMDELYNWHVKRFYTDRQWRRKFVRRLWQHRKTLAYMVKNWSAFLAAKREFEPDKS